MDTMSFELSSEQVEMADAFADRVERKRAGQASIFESSDRPWKRRMSARAEVGLASLLHLPWTGGSTLDPAYHLPDVGDDIEVRWTNFHPHDPWLMLQKRELSIKGRRWVLATGKDRLFTYHGWRYGYEVMIEVFWDQEMLYPCYHVDVDLLRPMSDLLTSEA